MTPDMTHIKGFKMMENWIRAKFLSLITFTVICPSVY